MSYINPMWFYWLEVVDLIKFTAGLLFGLVLFALASVLMLYIVSESERDIKKSLMVLKPTIVVFVVLGLIVLFVPSKNTMIQMKVAENVTHENVDIATEIIKDTIDYIFEKAGK